MSRTTITTQDGQFNGWFESDTATRYRDNVGDNDLQAGHCDLYQTAGRAFLLNFWDHYEGSRETFVQATNKEVAEWIIENGEPNGLEIPADIQTRIDDQEV